MKKTALLDISISLGEYGDFVENIIDSALNKRSAYACVANVHMMMEARSDSHFAGIVSNASYITPDGKPLVWALRMLKGIKQDRVAGMDLLPDLLQNAALMKIPVFFYGGSAVMLAKTKQFMEDYFPSLLVSGYYSPPFRDLLVSEEDEIATVINNSGAGLVFVILGCPKQEKWMARMNGKLSATTVGIGGAIPVLIGSNRRAPKWMQDAGLEWCFRLIQEPTRLFKRYVTTNSRFIVVLLAAYFNKRVARITEEPKRAQHNNREKSL